MKDKFDLNLEFGKKKFKLTIDLNHFYYIPFIGWMYPMAFKKDDPAAMSHAKQGFVLALFFTALLMGLSFFTVFVHTGFRAFRLFITILIYLTELAYFALCIRGTMMLVKGKPFVLQRVKKYVDMINV